MIELIDYLGLSPKSEMQNKTQHTTTANLKPTKRNFKFLQKIPLTSVIQSEVLFNISKLYELKTDPAYKKIKYVGSDYERFVNNYDFVELNELCKKRELKTREVGVSRSTRLLKREMKKCSINVKKLSFEDILQYNVLF